MKTKVLKFAAFILILAGSFFSCNKQGQGSISSIDSVINIRMVETFNISPRTVQFYCSTSKTYPCCNYSINVEHQRLSNVIDISFKNIIEHDICLTALGTATAVIDLGALSNGTYRLNFHNGNVRHIGELIVTSERYKINISDNPAFRFTNTPLNRIPAQTIWGTIGYHKQETSSLVQSFIAELIGLGATKKFYNSGVYDGFDIDKKGDIVQPGKDSGYWFAQSFIFHYSGNIDNVEQLVKQYAHDYGVEYMYISVYSDKGENFLSWMY